MLLVNAGVVNVPDVPVIPLGDDEHEVLRVDDQVIVVVALYAMAADDAEMVMIGAAELSGGGLPGGGVPALAPEMATGAPHAERASPKTTAINNSL